MQFWGGADPEEGWEIVSNSRRRNRTQVRKEAIAEAKAAGNLMLNWRPRPGKHFVKVEEVAMDMAENPTNELWAYVPVGYGFCAVFVC